jgi:hypothetical protein
MSIEDIFNNVIRNEVLRMIDRDFAIGTLLFDIGTNYLQSGVLDSTPAGFLVNKKLS